LKLGENQSVVAICEQVLESMDPNATKALWLMGKAYCNLKEYDQSVDALSKAVKADPANADFRQELERVKKIRQQENHK
jgi:cytochrome c-type biogenesis protein CcmH/NrfG